MVSEESKVHLRNLALLRKTRRVAQQQFRARMHEWSHDIYQLHIYEAKENEIVSYYPIDGWKEDLDVHEASLVQELHNSSYGDEAHALEIMKCWLQDIKDATTLMEGLHRWAPVLEATVLEALTPC